MRRCSGNAGSGVSCESAISLASGWSPRSRTDTRPSGAAAPANARPALGELRSSASIHGAFPDSQIRLSSSRSRSVSIGIQNPSCSYAAKLAPLGEGRRGRCLEWRGVVVDQVEHLGLHHEVAAVDAVMGVLWLLSEVVTMPLEMPESTEPRRRVHGRDRREGADRLVVRDDLVDRHVGQAVAVGQQEALVRAGRRSRLIRPPVIESRAVSIRVTFQSWLLWERYSTCRSRGRRTCRTRASGGWRSTP